MKLVSFDVAASPVNAQPNATLGSRTLTALDLKSAVPIAKLVFVARSSDVPLAAVADKVPLVQVRNASVKDFGVVDMLSPAGVEVGLHSIPIERGLAHGNGTTSPIPMPIE